MAKDNIERREVNLPQAMLLGMLHETIGKIPEYLLVERNGRRSHKEFSIYDFIAIAVGRDGLQILVSELCRDAHERSITRRVGGCGYPPLQGNKNSPAMAAAVNPELFLVD